MNMKILKAASVAAYAAFLSGCVATQQDMLQMQSQMDDLNTNLSTMQKNQADLAIKMDDLTRNLVAFSEELEEVSKKMDGFNAGLTRVNSDISSKVSNLSEKMEKQQKEVAMELLPDKIYAGAYSRMANGNYDEAVLGFAKYIKKFPKGELLEGAYYNLARSYYSGKRWKEAAIAYAAFLDKFAGSFRVPSARLHYALALLKLPENKKDEAEKYLKSVIKDYPRSPEAETAGEKLKGINKSGAKKSSGR